MGHKVAVAVVPKNPLMVSVECTNAGTGFLLSVEEDFINELTQEELEAAIAHELGHVWISPIIHSFNRGAGESDRTAPRAALQSGAGLRKGVEAPGHQGQSHPVRRRLTLRYG